MPSIELYGYPVNNEDMEQPLALSEVTFSADPSSLREVARFLLKSADDIEKFGSKFGYNHLRDEWPGWVDGSGDVIVCKPTS